MTQPQQAYVQVDPPVRIEIEASWRDVDALTVANDLIVAGDILSTVVAAQVKGAVRESNPSTETIGRLRSLIERIVGKLPPRGTVVDAPSRAPQSSAP